MKKLIILVLSGMLLLATGARSEEIFLKCVTGETSNYTYINTTKKLVGEAYLQKNKKDLYIYDWIHEDVKISDKEIEYKSTMSFWRGYSPKNKNYHKIVVDRYSGSRQSYIKDPYIFKSIPKFFDNIIDPLSYTWLFQNWEKSTVLFCEKSNFKNLNFIFKSKRDFEIEKEQSQNNSKKF
jgi:hypothetical protein